MKVTIVGSGYVGLVTGACLADAGNEVWCVDKNEAKIKSLANGVTPIYEPGLEEVIKRGLKEKRLYFTNNLAEGLDGSQVCFLTVDTPSNEDGSPDLTNVFNVAETLGDAINSHILVVTKSTVPVGTTVKIKEMIQVQLKKRKCDPNLVAVASNPEFLKEGTAVQDCRYPDRIVVGVEKSQDSELLKELYEPFMRKRECFLIMDIASSELSKYAANAMLATRISFMNEMAGLCEKVGADIRHIRHAVGWDPRIGSQFLYPGLGYGGSCLPKDISALIELGKKEDCPVKLIEAVDAINQNQREKFLKKIVHYFGGTQNLKGKGIAMWGLAFKPETDDIRQAPSLFLIEKLLEWGAEIRAFDPVAMDNVRPLFGKKVTFCPGNYQCLEGADCLVITTEWNEFRSPNFLRMKQLLNKPVLFDGRNLYEPQKMKELGFDYFSIGR